MADTTKKKKLGFPLGVDENMFYNPVIEGDKIEETPIIPNSELFYSGIKTNTGDYTVDDFVQGAINNSREKNRVVGADGKEYTFDELDDLGISSIDAFFQGYSNNMYGKKAIKKGFELPSPNPLSYQPTIGDKVVYAGADEEGNPILKLVDGNEEDIKKVDGIVFDIYGPKPTSRSFTSAFYANVRNALSPVSIGSQLSSFLELTTDIGEMSKNYLDPNIRRFESEEGTTDDIAEYFSNKKRIDLTSPTLEESEHPWSSAAGISGNLGNAAASMVLYGGYGRALSVFKSPNFSMWGAGLILNTGEAYESAKQSGLDEEDAAMLSLSVGFINTALEQKFGANLVNRWLSGGGSREISKIVLDETKGVLDKATLNAVSNTVYNRVLTGIKNFTEKQIIGSASEEFFEEGMQTLIGKTAEVLYDRAVEGSDKKTFGTRFDKDTWAEIFGSAAIGAIMGGVGGAFVPKGKEANIYDYVIKGKTDQVFAVLDQMKLKGDITPEQFDSYTERLNMLSDLWGKNSTVFKEIKEAKNDKINTAAFSHIDGIFHAKNKLENIDAQIEAVRNDNSLVDVVKEEKIAELELKKINIKDEIQFRESYLKNFIKDSNGKVAVLDNPKIASTKYTNEQFTKFILDKENQSHEETLRAAIAEQQVLDLIPEDQLTDEQKEDKETLDGLIKHTQELIDEKNKIIQSIDDNRVAEEELEAQELQNKKAEEKQEILEQKKEDSETPVEKIDDKPVLGYVQKVQPNGLLESIEEYPFVAKTFNQTTGRNEYDIVLPDGSIERVDNPTFVETDGSSGTQSSGKVVLNGVDHFSNPLFWNYYREVEMLKNISAAEGISEAELLEAYGQEGFPAHYQRALLEHILATRPNWRDYVKLEAVENKQSPEYLAKPVDLKNKRIRGKRYSGVNITLSITNPETGEVYRLAHTLDTDFFEEVIDERTVVPIDFLKLDYNEFNSKFAFRSFGEKNERNATPEEYEKFLLVYESAMTFNKWVNKWYSDNNYKDIVPIPEEAYSLEPYGMLDFKHKLDPEVAIADIPVLENAPIIAPFQSTLKTINGLPLPSGLDFNLEITSGAYYALAQFPNGYNTWVRLNGKTIEHDKELEKELSELIKNANNFASNFDSTTALNTLVEFEGSEVELKQAFKTLSDRLGFIQSNDPRISVNWSIDVPMASEGALPNYQVKLEFKFTEEGKSIKGSSLYITDFESISDLLSQIKEHEKKNAFLINKARVLYSVDKSSFKSWPAYGDLGLNYKKKLYPITKPNVVKSWNVKIRFNGEALMKEVPLAVSNYTPSDIDESVPSEFSGTEIEDFIKEQETSIKAKKADAQTVKNRMQEIEKTPVTINITQDAEGKIEQTSEEVISSIKSELDKIGLPYSDVVANDKGSTYFVVTKDGQQHEILKLVKTGNALVKPILVKAKWINHLIKTQPQDLYDFVNAKPSVLEGSPVAPTTSVSDKKAKKADIERSFKVDDLNIKIANIKDFNFTYDEETKTLTINSDIKGKLKQGFLQDILDHELFHHNFKKLDKNEKEGLIKFALNSWNKVARSDKSFDKRFVNFMLDNYTRDRSAADITTFFFLEEYLGNSIASEYNSSEKETVLNNPIIKSIIKESEFLKKEINAKYDAEVSNQSKIETQIADIEIGKVGNTEYEVKVDGVYYQGKKLDNSENKTYRQLIEADIERRRREELNNIKSKAEIEKYFANKFKNEFPNGVNESGIISIQEVLGKLLNEDEHKLIEQYRYSNILKDKINAKYDAELAASENKKSEQNKLSKFKKEDLDKYDNIDFKIVDRGTINYTLTLEDARDWVAKRFGKSAFVQNIDTLIHNSEITGIPVGAVVNNIMYLRKIGDKTDMYHEAGHIVFNNFLTFKRQNAYIERIKNELKWSPKQLEEAKQKLRARSSRYRNMSDAALERKVYEEEIMDKYADWQTKREETRTWLSDFFNSLKSFVDWLFNNQSLVALFNQIDRGAFRNAKAKNKYGEIDFKIVPGFNPVTSNVFKSQLVGFMINAKLPATLSGFEKAYDMLLSTYDVDNSDVQKFIKNSTIEDLETKMAVVWSRLSKAEAKNVLMNEVIKFFKKNKYNPEVEVYDDSSSEEGDRVYDKPANEIDPTDTINEVVRNFLATTLAIDKDIFGRPVETVIPWQTVYNRLLPVLSVTHTKSSDIIRRLSYMSKDSNDTFIQAVYERLIKETGYSKETPDGVGTEGKNLLIAFKNAFALEQNLYLQAVLDNGQASIHIENKKDLGQKTKEEWEDDHIKNYLNKVNADKQIASKVNKDFEHLLLRLSSNPADVELSKFKNYRPENAVLEVLNSVGIKLQKKHAQAAFGEETDDVEERRIVNENKQPIITISDIKLISEYLKKGQPLFSGEEGVDTLASQIKLIATADARYNPFIVAKTYQDAAGKKRYSYSEANMMHSEIHKLRTDVYNESRYNDLLNRQNGYFKYNSLVNKSYQDAKNILNNLWPHLIYDLSVRDENQTEGITSKSATDGDFLVLMHMYYQRTIKNSETGNKPFAIFSMSQISDKTSQYGFFLPVDRYVTNGKLNELGKKDLWNMFKTDLFTKQEKFNTGYIFKGDLFFFDYLKSDINVGDYVKALISKETSIEDVTPEVENMIVKAIYDKLIQQANDHIKILQDMGLYDNVVTPALKKEYPNILDYFVNHQLNTFIKVNDAYKLIGGSPNYTKGWDDFIKRMGRIIAAGRDFSAGKSTTYHKVAFTDDQVVFVNPENFDETTTDSKKAKELGWDEINTTDAQVWSTTNSKLEDMRKLGLLTDALESVLLRMSVVKDNDGNLVFPNPDDVPTRDEIEAAGLDLIPSKQVTGGKTDDLKEVYNKMAVHYLSFVDLAYHDGEKWIPRPDRLSLYNKYMMMVNNDVTHLVPKSAAKMFYGSPVSHSFLNEYTGQTVNTYIVPDIYRRLQVQNSTKSKKNIVLSNQILNIIGSELPDTEENNRLKTRMQQSIARMKSQDLNFLDRILVGSDGKRPDLTVLLNTLMSIAEDSSGDSQMLEMLSHTNGKPNYDTNVAHISSKFTEMFFSRYKDVFRQKGFGRILTAVSSDGYNVIEDKDTGEIITDYTEYNSDKHKIRPLRGMRNSESGITPAEIFIPRKYAELYNLQVGQELTSDLFKTILYRVPSQSYHSAAIAKVVGFLPDYYGDTIVAPKEFVLLMGMDFDVDKLYMYSKAFYQNKKGEIIVYGKEKTLEQRFESYLKDLTENNPYIKAEYKRRLESDSSFAEVKEELKNARKKLNSIFETKKELRIHKGVLQRLNRTMQDILGDDNSELDQESLSENILFIKQDIAQLRNIVLNIPAVNEEIFDLMDSIVQRQEFELVQTLKYFNMPVNMEEFSKSSYIPKYQLWNDVVDSMYEIFSKSDLWDAFRMKLSTDRTDSFIETNKNKLSTADIVPGTPNAVYSSFKNARQGKVQTGIAVTNNTSIQFLLENNIVIDPEIIQETPIILNNEIIRQFNIDDLNRESMDAGSEILGRIVDNQKNPVADKLNLTPETMGIAYIITKATGDLDLALLFLQSPTLKAISEAKKNSERVVNPVDYFGETTKILKNLDNKEIELKKKSPSLVVNYIPVTKQNLEWLINNLNYETLSDDDKAKYIGLEKEIYRNYSVLKDIAGTTQAITTALSLNRSIDSDIASAYRVLNAFDTVEKNKVLPNAYGALMSNPVNQVNHDILKHALRTLSLYQITETYYANDVIDTVLGMLSSSGRKKYHQDIINSFMSSLQMAVIEKNEGSLLKHAELLMKNPKSLANIVSEFKSRKEYENNVFLKLLSTKMNLKEEAYDLVTADSRSKLSPEAQAAILDASTYIMHKEPELFRKLEKYLQLMDGMMFRNGSFVKMMPAETFKSVAKALEDINEVLTGNYNNEQRIAKFKELTGYDFNEFKNRFIDQFFMHIVNKRLPRTDYKGYNKEGKTIFNKTFINGILKINLVDKTNPETDIQVFKPVYNEDETLLKIDFPRYLRIKLETGGYQGFRLTKKTDFSAEYEPIIYIGDKRRKPYSLSIADNIKLQQMLKQDIKQDTPDTIEESLNLISDDNSVFFEQESVGDIASQIPVDESTYIPAFGKAVAKPEEKLKINIYSGTGENAELSNFANRPFTDDGIGDLGMNYEEATGKSIVFNTVEGFFQASKIQYSNSSEYWDKSKDGRTLTKRGIELIEKFAKATGSEAKSLGRTIKELDTKEWDKYSSQEMKGGLLASFEQNPDALVKLLSTGNATLTHTQDKGKWGVEFPKLLMEVRTELAKQQTQNLWSQYQQASIENNKTVDLTQAEFEALSTEEQETIIYQIKNCK